MKLIKSIDAFSTKPEFLVDNASRMQTTFGGLLTALTYIMIIVFSCIFGVELVQKAKPNVYYNNVYVTTTDKLYYGADPNQLFWKYDFLFNKTDSTPGTRLIDDRAVNLYGLNYQGEAIGFVQYNLHLCDNDPIYQQVAQYFDYSDNAYLEQNKASNMSYCIDVPKGQNLFMGNISALGHAEGFGVYLGRCTNNTREPDQLPCYPDEVIDNYLLGSAWFFDFLTYQYDPLNYTNPAKRYVQSYNFGIGSGGNTEKVQIGQTQITTDEGLVFTDLQTNLYFQIDDFIQSPASEDGLLVECIVEMGPGLAIYKRNYYKIQNWLADVGGVLKALMTLASLVNYWISDFLFYRYVGNILFEGRIEESDSMRINVKNEPSMIELKDKSIDGKIDKVISTKKDTKIINKKVLNFQHYLKSILCCPDKKNNFFIAFKRKYQKLLNIDYYLKLLLKIKKINLDDSGKPLTNNYFQLENRNLGGDTKDKVNEFVTIEDLKSKEYHK